jgi:hypothetical protein
VYVGKTLLAGGVAGCVAKTAVAPLDRVKILFQAGSPHFRALTGTPATTCASARVTVCLTVGVGVGGGGGQGPWWARGGRWW